jgi:GR25 family glycosyltransferase involved in LPS biosynthesis
MNDLFDKIYIINLKESTERRQFMETQLQHLCINNYKIIEPVGANNIDIEYLKSNKLFAYPNNDFCKKECSCGGNGHILTSGQIDLHLAHFKIWNDMIQNNYSKCLILEDDCIFTENMRDFVEILSVAPANWKLLYLGHSQKIHQYNSENIDNPFFFKLVNGINETHIYAVTNECAQILIDNTYPIRAAIDGYLAHFMINNRVLSDVYICKTMFGINGSLTGNMKSLL